MSIPKPDSERLRRNAPTFEWTLLPKSGRKDPPPPLQDPPRWLADLGGWPPGTRTAWKRLWETPQSTAWDQTGKTLHMWAQMHASVEVEGPSAARLAELRQIEDRHGLNPAALLRLRWRIVDDEFANVGATTAPADSPKSARKPKDRKARVLRLVADGEATTA